MEKKAVVFGGHVQGLGIVRVLGRLGYSVSLLDTTKYNIARHSKYCKSFHVINNEKIVPYLLSGPGIKRYQGSILFPTNDEHVELLSKNFSELQIHYKPATDKWKFIKSCFNKRLTYKLAKECGVDIPVTYFPDSDHEVENLKSKIDFPCIIKPAVMYKFYNSFRKKVFICNNENDLSENYSIARKIIPADEIIIQEIIPGGSHEQYSVGCLFNRNKPIASLAARRLRQHPIDFGNATTYAETIDNKKLIDTSHTLLKKISYKGICEVEFKRDPRCGTFKLLEINPRSWKWHAIAEAAKVPFIESYTKMLKNEDPDHLHIAKHASWSHYITDIPVIIKLIMWNMYQKPKRKNHVRAVLQTDDLKPAFYELIYFPYLIKSR
jgi:D-aspartate ligase